MVFCAKNLWHKIPVDCRVIFIKTTFNENHILDVFSTYNFVCVPYITEIKSRYHGWRFWFRFAIITYSLQNATSDRLGHPHTKILMSHRRGAKHYSNKNGHSDTANCARSYKSSSYSSSLESVLGSTKCLNCSAMLKVTHSLTPTTLVRHRCSILLDLKATNFFNEKILEYSILRV